MGILSRLVRDPMRNISPALKLVRYGAAALVSTQAATIATVVAIDEIRKLRGRPHVTTFPTLPPQTIDVDGSELTVYVEGRSLYADMLEAIRSAKKYIFFETFIWKDDPVGREFKAALIAAAQRGVKVYIIYDGFANIVVNPFFKKFPKHPNLFVYRVPEVSTGLFTLNLRKTGRDHRKIMVCDGEIGFVGGYNIGELYAEQWRDTHVRIRGKAVWELDNAFVDFWNAHCAKRFPVLPDRGAREWEFSISAALNSPRQLLFPVRGLYIYALERATKTVEISSAYFIPDNEIQHSLIAAARRGVHVRVLIPEISNHILADWAAYSHFSELLAEGVEIWLYQNAMIHAKTAVVDGRWSTVGTANIDRLSMTGNYEVNLQIINREAAATMEAVFANDLKNSRRLTPEEWAQRSILTRIAERLLRPLAIVL